MDSKNNLVQAFMKLYKNNSIERISVKEITLLAGYNRTTFILTLTTYGIF